MAIDYSKWDKIELSDDSDIEVHPNVDKNSFIKWKQRDIHEKRAQRNVDIKNILIQLSMYSKLNERVDYLLSNLDTSQLLDQELVNEKLKSNFDPTEKFDYETLKEKKGDELRKGLKDLHFEPEEIENLPTYNDMIEDLFVQIKEDHEDARTSPDRFKFYMTEHRSKIDNILSKESVRLDDLLYQKAMLISSDDIHTAFDRSFLNKDTTEELTSTAPPKSTEKKEVVETINDPHEFKTQKSSSEDSLDDLTLLPATNEFSKISMEDLNSSAEYLLKHVSICNESQKDALIMTSFDYQLEGDSLTAKRIIHQSLLLQYISQLSGSHPTSDSIIRAIKLFCAKIGEPGPAREGFYQDVDNTFNHIKKRCEIIKEEAKDNSENGGEELIQLKSLDDATELVVNVPEKDTEEYKKFSSLSPAMQAAVLTRSLEEVNKIFATMKIDEAEKVLETFNECGIIGINDYLEDEEEYKQLKKEYEENERCENHDSADNEFTPGIEDTVD